MYTRGIGSPLHVVTPAGNADLQVNLLGGLPILRHFLDRMGFHRIVGSYLGSYREGILDHAQTLAILVQNIVLSPAPLYRIAEWAAPISPAALGITAAEKASINDDRIARSLDVLASTRARSVFFHLALHVIKRFEIDTGIIHNDTTTITFHGSYAGSIQEPRITNGHNKDHRPDLKQLVFGLNIARDGAVPILHEIYSGNRADDTTHCSNVEHLRELLGRNDFVYVADSKLCTQKNLNQVASYGGKFVTVMPRTRSEDKDFRSLLRSGTSIRWRKLLALPNHRRESDAPDIYWTTTDGVQFSAEGYRLVWCKSSQKALIDTRTRSAAVERAEANLREFAGRLSRGRKAKKGAIRTQVDAILRQHGCERFLHVTIHTTKRIQTRRFRPGRPTSHDPIRELVSTEHSVTVERDKGALRAEARTDGVFPLITNLDRASKKEVLGIYKGQSFIEKRHALQKSELEVAPVYLKRPRRAVGLLHASFLAMMLDALIERALRRGMLRHKLESLPILPEGRPSQAPTTARLLETFSNVAWYQFRRGEDVVVFPVHLTPLQKQLLQLLGIEKSVYQ